MAMGCINATQLFGNYMFFAFFKISISATMELSNGAQVIELNENGDQVQQVQNLQNLQGISFHDITYEVKQTRYCQRINNKVILNSIR